MSAADEEKATSVNHPLGLVRLLLDETVFVKMRGDRELKGRLNGFDNHCNLVLSEVEETIYVVVDEDEEDEDAGSDNIKIVKKRSDMLFVRGDAVILIAAHTTWGGY